MGKRQRREANCIIFFSVSNLFLSFQRVYRVHLPSNSPTFITFHEKSVMGVGRFLGFLRNYHSPARSGVTYSADLLDVEGSSFSAQSASLVRSGNCWDRFFILYLFAIHTSVG